MHSYVIMKVKHLFGEPYFNLSFGKKDEFLFPSFRFRWATSLIEYFFTLLVLVSLVIRYVWTHTIIPILAYFHVPLVRKRSPITFHNDTVLITGGQSVYIY